MRPDGFARAAWVLTPAALALASSLTTACMPRPKPLSAIVPSRVFNMPLREQCQGAYDAPQTVGPVGEDKLAEASGIVASPTHPGVLWLHNDSGDDARLFAISTTGAALGELALPGVNADDFEDIAAAPCPDLLAACLYVCDCGDNALTRGELVVYAVLEPDVAPDRPLVDGSAAQQIWRFELEVPGGPANVEGFVVLPDVSAMIFFEKQRDDLRVLRLPAPWTADARATLEIANRITAPGVDLGGAGVITDADIHPTGERLLLRTYIDAFEARVDIGGVGVTGLDGPDFVEVFRPIDEPQGEAIAYDDQGTGIWTVSESPDGTPNQPLHHATCR